MTIFARIGEAMRAGGYADFKEFADTAVAAGFHDEENINLGAFIDAGSPRPAEKLEDLNPLTTTNRKTLAGDTNTNEGNIESAKSSTSCKPTATPKEDQ